jgi:hypothetical protein
MNGITVNPTVRTVADYLADIERGDISINNEYQRSGKVWPVHAQAFFIETILLGYPIPKLSLHLFTDIKARATKKEIVDGQQRTTALSSFREGKLRLRKRPEIPEVGGLGFEELPDDFKERFLSYSLPIDHFVGASPGQVRQIFRRMNSYTAPLSPEEKRHAEFQGELKFFILDISRLYGDIFRDIGVFSERQLVRMADAGLVTEIVDAVTGGIRTTKASDLDRVYKKFDDAFPDGERFRSGFDASMACILRWKGLHKSELMRRHTMGSLLCALMHALQKWDALEPLGPGGRGLRADEDVLRRLGELEAVSGVEDLALVPEEHQPYWKAIQGRTNVRDQREVRFKSLLDATSVE